MYRAKTPAPHPHDHLSTTTNTTTSSSMQHHLHSQQHPCKGASQSLLATTMMHASSPSLLGTYWGRAAGSLPSYNTGCVNWIGNGTWTRAERGNWAVTGTSAETPGPGVYYTDDLARERASHCQRGTSTTFGVLGHQEDSHLDRLEKMHRQQPGPADNISNEPKEFELISKLNTLRRELRTAKSFQRRLFNGASLKVWEKKFLLKYGEESKNKKFQKYLKEMLFLEKRIKKIQEQRKNNSCVISRLKSERTTSRFVLMDQLQRAKRAEPGPSDYQDHVTKRDFGVDGFTQRISNIPRLVPGHNYKQVHKGLILLQKDNSYLDVGPGQYEPSRAPAIHATKHAPPQIPILNPRSRASGKNFFSLWTILFLVLTYL